MHAPIPRETTKFAFNVGHFNLLKSSGSFDDFAKSELIEGELFVVNAQFRRHWWVRRQLVRAFDSALADFGNTLVAADECNVQLSEDSMPQLDIALTTEPFGDGPLPLASIKLIVEIADSTLENDLGRKLALYASHGIPEYWVVDVEGRVIHKMWEPAGEGYAERREFGFGAVVEAATVAGVSVATERLG